MATLAQRQTNFSEYDACFMQPLRCSTHVSTDKPIYRAGDTVFVRGVLLNPVTGRGFESFDADFNGTFKIIGPSKDVVFEQSMNVPVDSVLAAQWRIPNGQIGGNYTVKFEYTTPGYVSGSRDINIREFSNPRMKLQLEFLTKGLGPRDHARAQLEVNRAEGGVPRGARVTSVARLDNQEVFRGQQTVPDNGMLVVEFDLPASIERGEGSLSCTVEDGGVVESTSQTIPVILAAMDIKAYPEGGAFIAGLECGLYVECFTPYGDPADLRAEVIEAPSQPNASPEVLAVVVTAHEGRGKTAFVPQRDRQYCLRVTAPSGILRPTMLPPVAPDGVSLRSTVDVHLAKNPVMLSIASTRAAEYRIALFKKEEEIAETFQETIAGYTHDIVLTPPMGAFGTLRATVFEPYRDASGLVVGEIPVAERLIFREMRTKMDISVVKKACYTPGEQVSLTLRATEAATGLPLPQAVLGVTITDDSVLQMVQRRKQAPRLPVQALLEQDVEKVMDCQMYLQDTPRADLAIDLLLGTQGWRRFAYVDIRDFLSRIGSNDKVELAERMLGMHSSWLNAKRRNVAIAPQPMQQVQVMPIAPVPMQPVPMNSSGAVTRTGGSVPQPKGGNITYGAPRGSGPPPGRGGGGAPTPTPLAKVASPAKPASVSSRQSNVSDGYVGGPGAAQGMAYGAPAPPPAAPSSAYGAPPPPPSYAPMAEAAPAYEQEESSADDDYAASPAMDMLSSHGAMREDRMESERRRSSSPPRSLSSSVAAPARAPAAPAPAPSRNMYAQSAPMEESRSKSMKKEKDSSDRSARKSSSRDTNRAFGDEDEEISFSVAPSAPQSQVMGRRMAPGGGGAGGPMANRLLGPVPSGPVASVPPPVRPVQAVVRIYAHPQKPRSRSRDQVRDDFAETVYWAAGVKTNQNGEAALTFALNDAITSFRVMIDGFTLLARMPVLGEFDTLLKSVSPFYVEFQLPPEVTLGDHLMLPVILVNETDEGLRLILGYREPTGVIALTGTQAPAPPVGFFARVAQRMRGGRVAQLVDNFSRLAFTQQPQQAAMAIQALLNLAPKSRARFLLEADVAELKNGSTSIALRGTIDAPWGRDLSDEVVREVQVVEPGFPVTLSCSGSMPGEGEAVPHSFALAEDAVVRTVKTTVTLYPSAQSCLDEAVRALIAEPSGCFEQTSSTMYPMVMALLLMMQSGRVDARYKASIMEKLDRGYKRCVGYEVKGGGFSWFGSAPASEALTAMGIMQFNRLAEVYPVDQRMMTRQKQWLLKRRNNRGGWNHSSTSDHYSHAPPKTSDAYILWALTEAGCKNELMNEFNHLQTIALNESDSYVAGLVACALYTAGRRAEGDQIAGMLAGRQAPDGRMNNCLTSVTGSTGVGRDVEGTSVCVMAWIASGRYPDHVANAIKWIQARNSGGRFGSTQATVWAIQAVLAYNRSLGVVGGYNQANAVTLYLDDQPIQTMAIPNTDTPIIMQSFAQHLQGGRTQVLKLRQQNGRPLPYSVSISYKRLSPDSAPDCAVEMALSVTTDTFEEGESGEIGVTVTNRLRDQGLPMVTAVIGLPAGLEARQDKLKELVTGNKIDFFETKGRNLILYWVGMAPGQVTQFNIDVLAKYPGEFEGPASRVYLYYTDELKHWLPGIRVAVTPRMPQGEAPPPQPQPVGAPATGTPATGTPTTTPPTVTPTQVTAPTDGAAPAGGVRFCEECGTKAKANAKFCGACGAKF